MAKKSVNSKKNVTKKVQDPEKVVRPNINEEDKQKMIELTKTMRWQSTTIGFAVLGVLVGLVGQYQTNQWLQYSAIVCWFVAAVCYVIFAKKRNAVLIESELRRKAEKEKKKFETENKIMK